MSNYQKYLQDKAQRDSEETKRKVLEQVLGPEIVAAIASREDMSAKILAKKGRHKIKPDDVLLILEQHGFDVTEEVFNQVTEVYSGRP